MFYAIITTKLLTFIFLSEDCFYDVYEAFITLGSLNRKYPRTEHCPELIVSRDVNNATCCYHVVVTDSFRVGVNEAVMHHSLV